MSRVIKLVKAGNFLTVTPTNDKVFEVLKKELSFFEPIHYHGYEAVKRKQNGLPVFENKKHELFQLDFNQNLATTFGFWKLIQAKLKALGYSVKCQDLEPENPNKFKLNWDNISGYSLREGQPEFIEKVIKNRCGRFDCPTGFGKSFMLGIIAALFPKARIDIVTTRLTVLMERIYPTLQGMVDDVGIVCSKQKVTGRRVMCYSAGSLKHAPADADILFGDECHELASDTASAQLVRWSKSRNFGLSASHDMRYDKKDLRVHGIFGPIIHKINYKQAESANLVVPIKVYWTKVMMDRDPLTFVNSDDIASKKRFGIWRNEDRNMAIAADANKYDEDTQVLIVTETVEHAMNLKKLLPDFTLVYRENGLSRKDKAKYVSEGCISNSEPDMDMHRRKKLTQDFEKGKLKKAICTTIWNVGVSFNSLQVLIRAEGGGSSINDIQIPGRVSRLAESKSHGIIHDYVDSFNPSFERKARSRRKNYESMGWLQYGD